MFVRGGVYVVVRDSMGPFVARLSVSSLIFDYILTGPISVVSAGPVSGPPAQRNQRADASATCTCRPTRSRPASASLVTIYFWWSNIKGIHESSGKALRIMQITTVMVVAFLIWCPITLLLHEGRTAAAGADPAQPAVQRRTPWAGSRAPSGRRSASSPSSSRSATRCSP